MSGETFGDDASFSCTELSQTRLIAEPNFAPQPAYRGNTFLTQPPATATKLGHITQHTSHSISLCPRWQVCGVIPPPSVLDGGCCS